MKQTKAAALQSLLMEHSHKLRPVILWNSSPIIQLDFSANNSSLSTVDLKNIQLFNEYVFGVLGAEMAQAGIGGYLESRIIYQRSNHFGGAEARSVHLGIDVWMMENTPIYAPLDAILHSFQDNKGYGNYGPTIILEHRLAATTFYTLYGHLSRKCLDSLHVGDKIIAGEAFCDLGNSSENGDWPSHLHFQVMTDMLGNYGDFPGVAAPTEIDFYRNICADPSILLQIPKDLLIT